MGSRASERRKRENMTSRFTVSYGAALLCMAALALVPGRPANAQAPAKLRFEVATIKPSAAPNPGGQISFPPGRLSMPNFPLSTFISFAYNNPPGGITGGPSWVTQDRYNLQAQAEGMPTIDEKRLMLQTLLAERFALKFHKESKEVDMYALVLARSDGKLGPKVTPFTGECGQAPPAQPCPALITPQGLRLGGQPMTMLANLLTVAGTRFGLGRRIEDRTGLTAKFNMDFTFAPAAPGAAGAAADPLASDGVSIFTALQEQLGVKLEPTRGKLETIVIDGAERPSEN